MTPCIFTRMVAGKLRRHGCVSWDQTSANDRLFLVAVVSRDEIGDEKQSTWQERVGDSEFPNFTNRYACRIPSTRELT